MTIGAFGSSLNHRTPHDDQGSRTWFKSVLSMGKRLFLVLPLLSLAPLLWAHPALDVQIDDLTHRIEATPEDATLYLKRAERYRAIRQWEAALADFTHAEQLTPRLDDIPLGRGILLYDAGRFSESLAELDAFLVTHSNHVEARVTRARAYVATGRPAKAAADFDVAIATAPSPRPEYYLERSRALAAMDPPLLDHALEGLDEGLERLGMVVTLELEAIALEKRRGSYDRAIKRVERWLVRVDRKERWWIRKAEILALAQRWSEAHVAYREAQSAIERLPPTRRKSGAVTELESQIAAGLRAGATHSGETAAR